MFFQKSTLVPLFYCSLIAFILIIQKCFGQFIDCRDNGEIESAVKPCGGDSIDVFS